jgi:hypothetical protein
MLSQQFLDKVNDWGMKVAYYGHSIFNFTLYVELGANRQAYKHFSTEQEAIDYMKNGLCFGCQGIWDRHINKFPSSCDIP